MSKPDPAAARRALDDGLADLSSVMKTMMRQTLDRAEEKGADRQVASFALQGMLFEMVSETFSTTHAATDFDRHKTKHLTQLWPEWKRGVRRLRSGRQLVRPRVEPVVRLREPVVPVRPR